MPASNFTSFLLTVKSIFQRLITMMSDRDEIQVWQKADRCGNICWHGYNPATGDYICLGTEAEMRIWIEQC